MHAIGTVLQGELPVVVDEQLCTGAWRVRPPQSLSAIWADSVGSIGSLMRNCTVRIPAANTRRTQAALSTTA